MNKEEIIKVLEHAKKELGGLEQGNGATPTYNGAIGNAFYNFVRDNDRAKRGMFVYGGSVSGAEDYFYDVIAPFQRTEEYKQYETKLRFIKALENTVQIPARDTNYLDSTLKQRLRGIEGAGSWFENMTEEDLLQALVSQYNGLEEFKPEGAMEGSTYFKIKIPGKNGITNLDDLPDDSPLYLSITHAGTGTFSVATTEKVQAKDEKETTIILCHEEGFGEVMATLHPGAPVAPSNIKLEDLKAYNPSFANAIEKKSSELLSQGRDRESVVLMVSKKQVKDLGFDMAKLTSDEMGRRLESEAIDVRGGVSLAGIRSQIDKTNDKDINK